MFPTSRLDQPPSPLDLDCIEPSVPTNCSWPAEPLIGETSYQDDRQERATVSSKPSTDPDQQHRVEGDEYDDLPNSFPPATHEGGPDKKGRPGAQQTISHHILFAGHGQDQRNAAGGRTVPGRYLGRAEEPCRQLDGAPLRVIDDEWVAHRRQEGGFVAELSQQDSARRERHEYEVDPQSAANSVRRSSRPETEDHRGDRTKISGQTNPYHLGYTEPSESEDRLNDQDRCEQLRGLSDRLPVGALPKGGMAREVRPRQRRREIDDNQPDPERGLSLGRFPNRVLHDAGGQRQQQPPLHILERQKQGSQEDQHAQDDHATAP